MSTESLKGTRKDCQMAEEAERAWCVREMTADEAHRIREIDVRESGGVVHKWVDGSVQAVPEEWRRPQYDATGWQRRAETVKEALAAGGLAFGAFDGDLLIGFVALRYRLADDVSQLTALWVSRDYRRQGIATALVGRAVRKAEESGARAVYVSAMPSESGQGFRPTAFVHRDLYDKEPEDIHMVKELRGDADWLAERGERATCRVRR